jgi:hypothetical protein
MISSGHVDHRDTGPFEFRQIGIEDSHTQTRKPPGVFIPLRTAIAKLPSHGPACPTIREYPGHSIRRPCQTRTFDLVSPELYRSGCAGRDRDTLNKVLAIPHQHPARKDRFVLIAHGASRESLSIPTGRHRNHSTGRDKIRHPT